MDAVSASALMDIFKSCNTHMKRQDKQLMATGHVVQALVAQVSELTTQLQEFKTESANQPTAPNPLAVSSAGRQVESCLPTPAMYSGEPQLCRSFVTKCSLFLLSSLPLSPVMNPKLLFLLHF